MLGVSSDERCTEVIYLGFGPDIYTYMIWLHFWDEMRESVNGFVWSLYYDYRWLCCFICLYQSSQSRSFGQTCRIYKMNTEHFRIMWLSLILFCFIFFLLTMWIASLETAISWIKRIEWENPQSTVQRFVHTAADLRVSASVAGCRVFVWKV